MSEFKIGMSVKVHKNPSRSVVCCNSSFEGDGIVVGEKFGLFLVKMNGWKPFYVHPDYLTVIK